mgnify:CR=1 FL=1
MNNKLTKIEYPNFNKIIQECKDKILEKFPQYGNSWHDIFISDRFWKKRLNGEIKEIWKAENNCQRKKEIIDAINILAMMYEVSNYKCDEETEIYKKTWRYG